MTRSNDKALAAFLTRKTEIDSMLACPAMRATSEKDNVDFTFTALESR